MALAALAALLIAGSPAAAAPTQDGWGFAIADDDWEWDDPGHLPSLEDGFANLAPRAFRFQMIWNAAELPWHMDRARGLIARVRAQGVEEIVVTFKRSVGQDVDPVYGSQPSAEGYAARTGEVVRQLADDVDVWGPANEPNRGEAWLPGVAGAQRLAEYYSALEEAVETWDPTAEITSPDFVDRSDLGTIAAYVDAYEAAGGGWGDHVAWHPYSGLHDQTTQTTLDLIGLAPPGASLWITEAGAFGRSQRGIEASETSQNDQVWWLATTLAGLPQVERIHYYHMRGNPQAAWDTGLMNVDGSPRLAWHTWCAMARGVGHPTCQPVTPPSSPPAPPSGSPPFQPPLAIASGAQPTAIARPSPPPDRTPPAVAIHRLVGGPASGMARRLSLRVAISEPAALRVEVAVRRRRASGGRLALVATRTVDTTGGRRSIRLRLRRTLSRDDRRRAIRVRVQATDHAGNRSLATKRLRLTRR